MSTRAVTFTLNGSRRVVETTSHTAVELLRDDLGMTGTKLACGGGQCGACVISVGGATVASCLLPVEDLNGAEVTTVEGLGGEALHPIQRAFIATDALQCGFCTPGFLVEAARFTERWRDAHGDMAPPEHEIEKALAGHLCRCGAYRSILAAVRETCLGLHDGPGIPAGRADALDKVTGAAKYTVDVRLPGMAFGVVVRSEQPHAELLAVEIDAASATDGFLGWVPLAKLGDRLRYTGQPIGALAAVTAAQARRAASLVVIEYRPLPASTTIDASLDEGAVDLHGRGWRPPSSNEAPATPTIRTGNRRGPMFIGTTWPIRARRRLAAARRGGDPLLIEGTWQTQPQAHTALEPHACVADWNGGRPTVHLSTQAVAAMARDIASHFELEPDSVTVIAEHVGGAFGAKQGLTEEAVAAVALSSRTGVPVAVVYDRQEELTVGGHRPGVRTEMAILVEPDRSLTALEMTSHSNGGSSTGQLAATWARIMYPGAPRVLLDYDVLTNRPPGKPFRAPGGPSAAWALEQAVDEAAARLGVDPVDLRRGWIKAPLQHQLLDWVESTERWRDRPRRPTFDRVRRGVGVALSSWFYGYDAGARVAVALREGRFEVRTAAQDMGNGTRTVLRDATAERLGVAPDLVDVRIGDSSAPPGPTSSGSRTTTSLGPTAARAAGELADRLAAAAADLGYEDATATVGGLVHSGELVPWPEILERLPSTSVEASRPADGRRPFIPIPIGGLTFGWGISHAAHLVEVEVDMATHQVRPRWVGAALAVGEVASPRLARSQVEGGVIQGLSYALHEEWVIDPHLGVVVSSDLDSYRLIGIGDTPPIDVHFMDGGFEHVAGGGVGMSELATIGVAAAVGNACAAATGVRSTTLPLRPESGVPV